MLTRQQVWTSCTVFGGLGLFFFILSLERIPSFVDGGPPLEGTALRALAATALIATWWITAPIPLAATSLLPIALFPVLGVLSSKDATQAYANDMLYLFLGGFIIAQGIQKWGLHRRMSLWVVWVVGTSAHRLVLGMMAACAFLSMWISNGASTMTLLPIALALIDAVDESAGAALPPVERERALKAFSNSLLMGLAYSASVGGMATPIGTPPNGILLGVLKAMGGPELTTAMWMFAFLPLVVVFLLVIWVILTLGGAGSAIVSKSAGREVIKAEIRKLGPMTLPEKLTLAVFATTAFLWIFRRPIEFPAIGGNEWTLPGWTSGLAVLAGRFGWDSFDPGMIHDSTVAIAMAVLMFFIPLPRGKDGRARRLMDWESAVKLPWGILLLFGGGFAVAEAFRSSGLSVWVAGQFLSMQGWNPHAMVAGVCTLMTFLTELTSNTATTNLMLPILASGASSLGIHPLLLMVPATISASCAFMLPVATAPNAIVFGSGRLRVIDMVRYGFWINLVGIVLVTVTTFLFVVPVFEIDPTQLPAWAIPPSGSP